MIDSIRRTANRKHLARTGSRPPGLSGLLLAIALLPAWLSGCGQGSEPGTGLQAAPGGSSAAERSIPVIGEIAGAGDLQLTIRGSTTLRARESVEVVPRQSGIVAALLVEEGDRVRAGQVLARLDDEEWRLQAQRTEARTLDVANRLARTRSLAAQQIVSTQEVDNLISDSTVAAADLELAELSVRNARITSPIDGIVTHRYLQRGQQVGGSQAVFEVADVDNLEARINIPERDATRVSVGQSARLLREEGGAALATGVVDRIRPVVDATSGTVQVTVSVAASRDDARLNPGQFVNVDIVTDVLSDRVTLPRTAVLMDGARPRVYVIEGTRAVERIVTLGHAQASRVEVTSGVAVGDTVVVVGQDNLRPDAPIQLMEVTGGAGAPPASDAR